MENGLNHKTEQMAKQKESIEDGHKDKAKETKKHKIVRLPQPSSKHC